MPGFENARPLGLTSRLHFVGPWSSARVWTAPLQCNLVMPAYFTFMKYLVHSSSRYKVSTESASVTQRFRSQAVPHCFRAVYYFTWPRAPRLVPCAPRAPRAPRAAPHTPLPPYLRSVMHVVYHASLLRPRAAATRLTPGSGECARRRAIAN